MKYAVIVLVSILILGGQCNGSGITENKNSLFERNLYGPLEFCTAKDMFRGFFTGTEPDPTVANSKCQHYFPDVEEQFHKMIDSFNSTVWVPSQTFYFLDQAVIFIDRYALWMRYCEFGQMFTKLDNSIETLEGITTVFYKIILNYAKILTTLGDVTTNFQAGKCYEMFRALGVIFHIVFDFTVPEDII